MEERLDARAALQIEVYLVHSLGGIESEQMGVVIMKLSGHPVSLPRSRNYATTH